MSTPTPLPRRTSLPDPEHTVGLRMLYPLLRTLFWLIFACFGAFMRRIGTKNVPKKGALLVFANHMSNTDPVLVQVASPRLLNFMARRELFDWPVLGPFLKWFRAFPVSQESSDKEALRTGIDLLERGHAVMMFPEGKLSPDGNLIEIRPGATLLLRRTGVPCICVGLKNTNRLMPHPLMKPKWAGFVWLTARWGTVRQFGPDATSEEMLAWIESELRRLSDQPQKA